MELVVKLVFKVNRAVNFLYPNPYDYGFGHVHQSRKISHTRMTFFHGLGLYAGEVCAKSLDPQHRRSLPYVTGAQMVLQCAGYQRMISGHG